MNSMKNFVLPLLVSFLFLTACKNDVYEAQGAAKNIPAKAASVTSINIEKLMQKADFEEVKQMSFYQNMINETKVSNPAIAAALENPATSGIDLAMPVYMTTEFAEDNPEGAFTHVYFSLKNVGDFEKLVADSDLEFESANGRKTVVTTDNRQSMTWNDELLVVSLTNSDQAILAEKVAAVFDMQPTESIAKNSSFRKAMNAEHDIVNWMSTNSFADNAAAKTALALIDLESDVLENNSIHSYADFENGRMVGHSDFYVNSSLGRGLIGRFFKKEVKTDFSKVIPAGNMFFATTVALDLRGIDQWLSERPQSREYVDFVADDIGGFSRREMLDVFNGDLLVVGLNSNALSKEDMLIAVGAKSDKAAKKMIQRAIDEKKIKEIEPGYYKVVALGGKDFSIRVNKGLGKILYQDGIFVYSPNEEVLEQIKDGNIGNELPQSFDNQTVAGWMNMRNAQDYMGAKDVEWLQNMHFNVNGKSADFIMETNDPNTNALKNLFQKIEKAYQREWREKAEEESEVM